MSRIKLIIFACVITTGISYSQILINEVCASNMSVIQDVQGDHPDWIEILNTGPDTVNLADYCLSDDPANLSKWCFPEHPIYPGEHLIIFASGKDISSSAGTWNTLINHGDAWRYILPAADLSGEWRNRGFDDSGWSAGPSGFGYGDGDDATEIPAAISIFLRKRFTLEDTSGITACILHLDYDDGFVAYINGREIARDGIMGNPPDNKSTATVGREAIMYSGGEPLPFYVNELTGLLQPGENILAIQVHNISAGSSDLTAIPFLSVLAPRQPPEPAPEILNLRGNHFHTNFKLDANGESLYLTGPGGMMVDSIEIPYIPPNHSYGRDETMQERWGVFEIPTPGEPNNTTIYDGYVDALPLFSAQGGYFPAPFQLAINAPTPGDTIYYSVDGTDPDLNSPLYQGPIEVASDMVVRARIIQTGSLPGRTLTRTFFSNSGNGLPVLCVSTDPYNLWDNENGIYVKGDNAQTSFPFFGSNFWEDWEREASIELYDEKGDSAFSLNAGIKIYGGWSRGHPQKSMAIFARKQYGTGKIKYRLFEDKEISEFESIIIRNSGNDWFGLNQESGSMFRDPLMTRLTRNMDIEHLASRQAVIYINGEYWGIQNIREKVNEHFLSSNKGVDPDNLELLESDYRVIQGDNQHYVALLDFLNSNDVMNPQNYAWIKSQMDIQNFINYQLAQIYYDNRDWPGNNIKYWRPDTPKGKWRWIMYDTDFGFGMWDKNKVYYNTLAFATDANGPGWPNPPWSTFMLRKLLRNQEFGTLFINSFADQINTSFHTESVDRQIDEMRNAILNEMSNHAVRWGGSYSNWLSRSNELKDFARLRPDIMRRHIENHFGLTEQWELGVDVSDQDAGYVHLNTIFLNDFPWSGIYFQDVPVQITAIPKTGYRFTGWSGGVVSGSPLIEIDLNSALTVTANFEIDPGDSIIPIVINEICYIQDPVSDSEDWLELFNNSDHYIDISEWILKDSDDAHFYSIKPGTLLSPHGYHVVCRNLGAFETVYPEVKNYEGEFGFGLSSSGDMVRLYTHDTVLVDSVNYGISSPWPTIPAGSGQTLALNSPYADNSLGESWELSSESTGTPGLDNAFIPGTGSERLIHPEDILYQNSPNPFSHETKIIFFSGTVQHVRISVYDLNGRLVEILSDQTLETGYHEFNWIPRNRADGIYILRADTPGEVHVSKMIKSSR
ncbi:MAG: CotH kinase family protein [Bacteroidota bacterium]